MSHNNIRSTPTALIAVSLLAVANIFPSISYAADRSSLNFDITARRYPIGVSMVLRNPANLRTGDNLFSGLQLQEIPNSGLGHDGPGDDISGESQPQSMSISVKRPVAGTYLLSVFAKVNTTFYLAIDSYDSAHSRATTEVAGSIAQGATQEFTIAYSPAPGSLPVIRPVLNTDALGLNRVGACGDITLSGRATAAGPATANGKISLTGDVKIEGDATATAVNAVGHSTVTGRIILSSGSLACFAADLGAAIQFLTASNDNARIPSGFLNAGVLRTTSNDVLTLSSGDYLVDRVVMSGSSHLVASGPVRLFVRQGLILDGQATAGAPASPLTIFSDSTDTLSITGGAQLFSTLYAPSAKVSLSGQSRIIGRIHAGAVEMVGATKVDAP